MKKEFIPYEQALALKELGFDEPCFMIYYDGTNELRGSSHFLYTRDIKAPLYQQAFKWFIDDYCLNSLINLNNKSYDWYFNIYDILENDVICNTLNFKTYEEAQFQCLKKLIELVKDEN